jgi:hypothetical protein
MSNGYYYNGVLINDLIAKNVNTSNTTYTIKDSNGTTSLSQYFGGTYPMSNTGGPKIGNIAAIPNLPYNITPALTNISSLEIAYYTDLIAPVNTDIPVTIPIWATKCSFFIIGSGGSGAGGTQGFNPSPGQGKNPQQGSGGGGGGSGAVLYYINVPIQSSNDIIKGKVGSGANYHILDQDGTAGGITQLQIQKSLTPYSFVLTGGSGGRLGSSNGGAGGAGGAGGTIPSFSIIPGSNAYASVQGNVGTSGTPSSVFLKGLGVLPSNTYNQNGILPLIQGTVGDTSGTVVPSGYGTGSGGGAAGTQSGPSPGQGSSSSPGNPGFIRIYWTI